MGIVLAVLIFIVACARFGHTGEPAQGRTASVTLSFRLVDDSLGVGVASTLLTVDSTRIPRSPGDTTTQFRLTLRLDEGVHSLLVRGIGYEQRRVPFQVAGDSLIDLGVLRLRISQLLLTDDRIPWCKQVRVKPTNLAAGTWINPAPDSAGHTMWILCSIRRPP